MSVLFATKTWEEDYKKMLAGGFDRKWQAIGYPFDDRMLILNNAREPDKITDALETLTERVCYTQDLKSVIERDFHVVQPNLYALGELTAPWSAYADPEFRYDYLCYVQGDCLTEGGDWVTPGIAILEAEPNVMVVSPSSEVNTWHDKDGYDHYMSDQAFLVRSRDFQNPEVYNVEGIDPDYPAYGGNSFEHMVGKYLKQSGRTRKILEKFWCHHGAY